MAWRTGSRASALAFVAMLAACGGGAPEPPAADEGDLGPILLAEACLMDAAMARLDDELRAADPSSLRYVAALQDKAVLLRDGERDADADVVEAQVAELDGRTAEDVLLETLRDVAALRQRRASRLGRSAC